MKSPSQGQPGERRGANTASIPLIKILCLICDYCTKGTHFGEPELYCLHKRVRDLHAESLQLIAPRLMVQYRDAWALCDGEFFKRASKELVLPVRRRKPHQEREASHKVCQRCGKPFIAQSNGQFYCSTDCRREAVKERRALKRAGDRR